PRELRCRWPSTRLFRVDGPSTCLANEGTPTCPTRSWTPRAAGHRTRAGPLVPKTRDAVHTGTGSRRRRASHRSGLSQRLRRGWGWPPTGTGGRPPCPARGRRARRRPPRPRARPRSSSTPPPGARLLPGRASPPRPGKEITVRLRVLMEPRRGATYEQILALARATEEAGLDGFFRGDHYLGIDAGDPSYVPTDSWTTLAGLAVQTSRIRLGTLMTAATFRQPGSLAIIAATGSPMRRGRGRPGMRT